MKFITKPAREPDNDAMGTTARRERGQLEQRTVARRMGIPASFLCHLEKGRRNWTIDLVKRFNAAKKGRV